MVNVLQMFCLVIFHVLVIREVILECYPSKKLSIEKYDGGTNEFLIWTGMAGSQIECVHQCYKDVRCITLQYNQNGTCSKFAAGVEKLKQWETDSRSGHVTYQLQGRGGFGEYCMSDDECHFPTSECRNSTCGCIIGYSFNPIHYACTHGCTRYSNSYARFPGIQLPGNDIEMVPTGFLQNCQKICSNMSNCKSFDFFHGGECYPKSVGVLDDPSSLRQGQPTHGVRNCFD